MNISNKDLNLLLFFIVLYQERNASKAALRLSLSQPAMSHKLNKLRHQFGDALFVKVPRGLAPTPRAHQLAPQVKKLVEEIELFYEQCEGRDFLAQSARIHIYTTDYMEQILLPGLLPILRQEAANLVLITHNTRGLLPREELEKGTCDLAIAGFFQQLPATFHQQRLLSEDFVVLASANHPKLQRGLDLATYLECQHILTTLTGDLNGVVDRHLQQLGVARHVVAGLSSFLAPSHVIRDSDLLLTCLRSLGEQAVKDSPQLRLYPLPFSLPRVDMMQIWHQRTDDDRLRRWLRMRIQQHAQTLVTTVS
ncbi:LysR family transcriptional regulator [Serratia microhaemolytica]|uniref:LysR family transcriptional regulator n=1 Tax=Serratia microhaemolytica TaxID=2675110 RepID=UPI000FDEF9FF|nr:LysR family transcriptional regulator [Serratia microhaemolytica]